MIAPRHVTATIGTQEPLPMLRVLKGESFIVTLSLSAPNGTPVLSNQITGIRLVGRKGNAEKTIDVAGEHSREVQGDWTFAVTSAVTRNALAGRYTYDIWITELTSEKVPVGRAGTLYVEATPGSQA